MPAIKLHKRLPNLSPKEEQIVTEMLCEMYASGFENGKPKWIPVTERLPEMGKKVVCCGLSGGLFIARTRECAGRVLIIDDKSAVQRKAAHWMPLPEPPKGE